MSKPASGSGEASAAARTISSNEHELALGAAPPACRRERSSRFSTSRVSRSVSLAATDVSSSRASSVSVPDRRPRTAAVIAVSGERKSCDTARSNDFWTASLRLRAFVSISCDSSSARRLAAATSVWSAGTTRSRIAASDSGSASFGTSTVPIRLLSTTRGRALSREPLSIQLSSTLTDSSPNAAAIRRPAARKRVLRARPAEQQTRHLGREVRLSPPAFRLLGAFAGGMRERAGRHPRR